MSPSFGKKPQRHEDKFDSETRKRLLFYASHPELINTRLEELSREWDVERFIETQAPVMTLMGLILGVKYSRKWLALPFLLQSMVLLHAIQGFYPLMPLFRLLGVRTEREIAAERYALKALRGDFDRAGAKEGKDWEKAKWAFAAARLSNL